jgi:hypothetical protein
MAKQLHKSFSDQQVRALLKRYDDREVELRHILGVLGIGRSRFFKILRQYRDDPGGFTVAYRRSTCPRKLSSEVEQNILKELELEKRLIEAPEVPLRTYNYSYIRDRLRDEYRQEVSVPTIIKRAKEHDFYLSKPKRKAHDREVLTNYVGELIQHDSSEHKWAPYAGVKWHLITSLDDHSRLLLHADFVERETSWDHIQALENVVLRYGVPYSYYTDSHSIFRFVQGRDSIWRKHYLVTDDIDPQWKQVLQECRIELRYALSPQAKGKIERPYGWLQDRVVRTCARENVKTIGHARKILGLEKHRYNNLQVHSTTGEIPVMRFRRALKEKRTLFRPFEVPPPFRSTKDVFSLKAERVVDQYRRVSFNNLEFKLDGVTVRDRVQLRIVPDVGHGLAEIRFWYEDRLVGIRKIKAESLNLVHF